MLTGLHPREVNGGRVEQTAPGRWRLSVPGGDNAAYRCAQLDDYLHLARRDFPWQGNFDIALRLRASAPDLPGTWGFGVWNDPFGLTFATRGRARRLPALPQTAWWFYASPHNHLAVQDDHPASGLLAATFASRPVPAPLLGLGLPALPLVFLPTAARILRRIARRFVHESATQIETDVTGWHTYRLSRQAGQIQFSLDDQVIAVTPVTPRGALGFVLWIDNQFAAFPPDGRIRMGALTNPAAWIEVEENLAR